MGAEIDRLEIQVEMLASNANKQLDALAAKLTTVSKAMSGLNTSKLGSVGGVASKNAGGVQKLSSSLNSLGNSNKRAENSTKSLASTFGSFYANCFLLIRGFKALGRAVDTSMDYIETFNYFNVAMDKIGTEFSKDYKQFGYDSAEEYGNSFTSRMNELTTKMSGFNVGDDGVLSFANNKNLSLNPEMLMNYQASVAAITNSVGLMGETSINAGKALTMLASDMSSLKNIDMKTVMTNFQSGLIGQSRALYKYGIDITNATLQTYAYKYGLSTAVSEMTQSDKMQLRLLAILDQSKVAWGDQANTINSVANQYRIFKQQISNVARMIGNLFIPILQAVLPVINGMLIALQKLIVFVGRVFGIDYSKIMDGISGGYGGGDNALGEIVDDADNVSDSMGSAEKASKKLQRTLLGFDQINKLNDNTDASSGGGSGSSTGGGGIDLSKEIGTALAEYEAVWNKALADSENKAQEIADRIVGAFKAGDYQGIGTYISSGITGALNSIPWESVYSIARNFGTGFAQFLNGLITPSLFSSVGKTIAGALNTAIYTTLSFRTTFDWTNLGLSIASGINAFFETFDFAALAQSVNTWVQGLFKTLTTAIANIDWLTVYDGIITFLENLEIETIGIIIGTLALKSVGKWILGAKIGESLAMSISTAVGSKLASLLKMNLLNNPTLGVTFATLGKQMGQVFMSGIGSLFGSSAATSQLGALSAFAPVATAITGIASIIGGAALAVTNFFSMWKDGFSWLKEILMVIGVAIAAVGAVILGVPAGIAAIVAGVVAAVATAAVVIHDNWDAICEWFSGIPEWFNTNVITPVCDFFKGLWESVSGFFSGLWNDICEVWGTVSEWFNEHVIEPVVGFFQGLWTRVKQIFEGLWIIVQAVWITVSGWFSEHVIEPVVAFFQGLWEKVSGFFSQLWEDIKGVWSKVSGWFNTNIITPVVTAFNSFKKKVMSIFDGIWTGIKKGVVGAMNAVIGGIETAINWIVRAINGILGGFNKVVSWAAKIADVDWGGVELVSEVRLSRISMYKSGGFPNTGEMFMARENGLTEMVGRIGSRAAVANNGQIVDGIAEAVYPAVFNAVVEAMIATGGGRADSGNIVVENTFKVDSETLYKMSQKGKEKYQRRYQVVTEF